MKYLPATKKINPINSLVGSSGNNNFAPKTGEYLLQKIYLKRVVVSISSVNRLNMISRYRQDFIPIEDIKIALTSYSFNPDSF